MQLTRAEQETIINFDEELKTASVFTYNQSLIRKLSKLSSERNDVKHTGKNEYEIPKSWIKVKPVSKKQREHLKQAGKNTLYKSKTTGINAVSDQQK